GSAGTEAGSTTRTTHTHARTTRTRSAWTAWTARHSGTRTGSRRTLTGTCGSGGTHANRRAGRTSGHTAGRTRDRRLACVVRTGSLRRSRARPGRSEWTAIDRDGRLLRRVRGGGSRGGRGRHLRRSSGNGTRLLDLLRSLGGR